MNTLLEIHPLSLSMQMLKEWKEVTKGTGCGMFWSTLQLPGMLSTTCDAPVCYRYGLLKPQRRQQAGMLSTTCDAPVCYR